MLIVIRDDAFRSTYDVNPVEHVGDQLPVLHFIVYHLCCRDGVFEEARFTWMEFLELVEQKEMSPALRRFTEEIDGFHGLGFIFHDIVVHEGFEVILYYHAVFFVATYDIGKQGGLFVPVGLFAQKPDGLGKTLEIVDQ